MKTKLTKLFNWRAVTRCFTLLAAVGLATAAVGGNANASVYGKHGWILCPDNQYR